MSLYLRIRRRSTRAKYPRLHDMQERMQYGGQRAAERIGPAASQARAMATLRIDGARSWTADRILDARSWTAPRLQRAAYYVQEDLSPRVGSLLSSTARRIEPPRRRRRNRFMTTLLIAGGAASAFGAMAMRRNAERMAERDEREIAAERAAARTGVSGNGQVQRL